MSYSRCSGNFSSRSLGGCLSYRTLSCGSSSPSNLVYNGDLCSPSTCQLGSSLYSGCQETYCEPSSCQTSCVVSRPCQTTCYRPRTYTLCNPFQTTYARPLGFGSRSSCSLGYRSRGFRPLSYGACGLPSLGYGSGFCHPTYFPFRSYQSIYRCGFC